MNLKKWKKNVRKRRRLTGQEYESTLGKASEIRVMKPPCQRNCRLKCRTKISEEKRNNLFNEFWDEKRTWDIKRQYVLSLVDVVSNCTKK